MIRKQIERLKLIYWLNFFIDRSRILSSGFFDAEWFKLAYPHIVPRKVDPLTYFLNQGRKKRLSPSRNFDTERYLEQHEQARLSELNPLVHYLKHGKALGLRIHSTPPSAADRIQSCGLFDAEWYMRRYPDVVAANYSPLMHYMVYGALEGRSPGPNFDGEWYLRRNPDISGSNPLLHYIDHGSAEGRLPVRPHRALTIAQQTLKDIEDLDPELYGVDFLSADDRIQVRNGRPRHTVARAFEKVVAAIRTPPRAIIFLPWLVHGGADLVASHAIRAIAREHGAGAVLVILSDHDREEAMHLLPKGVPYISFSRLDEDLSHLQRAELIDFLVRGLNPEVILNVNSHACWEAIKRYGQRLEHFTRLYAMLFCADFSVAGRRSGYSDLYLRHCLPNLAGVYFDNQTHINEVIRQFDIPASLEPRLVCLYQPAPAMEIYQRARQEGDPFRVLWAGRFALQKNVDLMMRIAESAVQFEFHIWGRGDETIELRLEDLTSRASNVHLHGSFESFSALPLENYDALLYTSLWDGLPNILLEASSAGLPIVASNVGGIGELVDHDTGWPVYALDDPTHYVRALEEIVYDPMLVQQKLAAIRRRLNANHSWQRHRKILMTEPKVTKGLLGLSTTD